MSLKWSQTIEADWIS